VDPRVADPLDREDGLMWMSPTLPMRGGDAVNVQRIAEEVLGAFKFDLLITYVVISGRAACAPITICFDRRSPEECQRASACYAELLTRMRQAGYDPYRLATSSMHYLGNCQTSHLELVGNLKDALDDQAIVAPGRYQAG
jgi:4-cresol dehydrogenase (hydroxylating)